MLTRALRAKFVSKPLFIVRGPLTKTLKSSTISTVGPCRLDPGNELAKP